MRTTHLKSRASLPLIVVAVASLGASNVSAQSTADAPVAAVIQFADATSLSTDATSLSMIVENRPPKEYPHVIDRKSTRLNSSH